MSLKSLTTMSLRISMFVNRLELHSLLTSQLYCIWEMILIFYELQIILKIRIIGEGTACSYITGTSSSPASFLTSVMVW